MKLFLAAAIASFGLVSGETKDSLRSEILPSESETGWQAIDWKTDLWEAREEAAKTGKPIYLWEMDGHPLGCV